jgi:hypothetical protein
VLHRLRDSIDAHLTIVFTALAVARRRLMLLVANRVRSYGADRGRWV